MTKPYRRVRQMILLYVIAAILLARYAEPYRPLPAEPTTFHEACWRAHSWTPPMCVVAP